MSYDAALLSVEMAHQVRAGEIADADDYRTARLARRPSSNRFRRRRWRARPSVRPRAA